MKTITALLAGTAIAAAALPAAAETWDMPMAYAATNFHSEVGANFGACVTDGTGGDLEIVTHPSGSLFPGNEIKRAVQTGQASIGERLLSAHQNENPLYGVDSIPFLVSSFDEHESALGHCRAESGRGAGRGQSALPLLGPLAAAGLLLQQGNQRRSRIWRATKFRSYSTATARLAELTGMLPVQIEAAEISQAFATGVADSMVSSGATGYDRKVWEHLNYFYIVDAWLPRNAVFVNMDAWNGLSDDAKAVMNECAATAKAEGLQRSKDYTQFTLDGLKEGGMTVTNASDTLTGELQAIGATMTEEWLATAGDDGKAIVDAYKAQ